MDGSCVGHKYKGNNYTGHSDCIVRGYIGHDSTGHTGVFILCHSEVCMRHAHLFVFCTRRCLCCLCTRLSIHTTLRIHVSLSTHVFTFVSVHTCIRAHVYAHTRLYTHTDTDMSIHACLHARRCARPYTPAIQRGKASTPCSTLEPSAMCA